MRPPGPRCTAAPYTTGTWTLGAGAHTLEEEARCNAQTGVTILNTPIAARSGYSAHSGHLGGPFLVQGWDRDCTPPQAIQFGSTREEARRVVRQPSWRTTRRSITPSDSLIIETRAAGKSNLTLVDLNLNQRMWGIRCFRVYVVDAGATRSAEVQGQVVRVYEVDAGATRSEGS
jgi:hypothetical protein